MAAVESLSSSQFSIPEPVKVPDAPKSLSAPQRNGDDDGGVVPLSADTGSSAGAQTAWRTSGMRRRGVPLPLSARTGGSVYRFQ